MIFIGSIYKIGTTSEAEMDVEVIMSIKDEAKRQALKDQRVFHHESTLLLSSNDSVAKYRNYVLERQQAPIFAAANAADLL
jgi:hypothetical protein